MKLRTKFLITIGTTLIIAFGVTFYQTARFQDQLITTHAERQARMLSRQIILTRKWVADHNGLFFLKDSGAEPNPFLDEPMIMDQQGRLLVKRNPAMVTRELSEYADDSNFCSFRVTSLKPVNPGNAPDEFETRCLLLFEQGESEALAIEEDEEGKRFLRFITALEVQESCLECHARHGYKVGDIRGGLSLKVPMAWADQAVKRNNRKLLFIAIISIIFVGLTLYYLIDYIIVRRLAMLAAVMERYPEVESDPALLPTGSDEIGALSNKFVDLGDRLVGSIKDLERTREQVFHAEKMASLGRLSAGIAHEVNNPLGGMRNCVKSIKEAPGDQELLNRYLDLLDQGLKRVSEIMRQLLKFGRNEPLKYQVAGVNDIISESFELVKYWLKDIELEMDFNLHSSYSVAADALRQVVLNLGLNAMQAMPEGGRLLIRTEETADKIIISIADTGTGIAEEDLAKVFDPFFTTKDIGEGTGLGLSVSYSLVQEMGGEIRVESKKGEGSCFIIELPKETAAAAG